MYDIGVLLKYLSEYISENKIIRYCGKPWAERIEDYIRDNTDQKITLGSLAKMVGRSTSFISHNFPQEFGMPLKEYIRRERMTRAQELLKGGSSVKETAAELGFYDEFHFSKEFKKYFSHSPIHFKN